jgi:putative chitinase
MQIDEQLLRQMWPRGDSKIPGLIAGIANSSEAVFRKYVITTPLQAAHLMSQLSLECGAGTEVIENLTYTHPAAMMRAWPRRFPTAASTLPYLRNPKKLADLVYGGRMGNRPGTEDGYIFRGRGGAQTTGRAAYERLGAAAGEDLIGNPDLLLDPDRFFDFAVADFVMCGCLPYCAPKPSLSMGDITGVTHHLNGGTNGLAERKEWFARWWPVLKDRAADAPPASSASTEGQSTTAAPADGIAAPPIGLIDGSQASATAAFNDGVLRYGRGHDAPDFEVKALQELLVSKGYTVGKVDGEFSGSTRAAVLAAQADNGLPTSGEVDEATKAAFRDMPDKPIADARATASVDDLKAAGSVTVKSGQQVGLIGKGLAFLGIGQAADASGALDHAKTTLDQVSQFRSVADTATDLLQWAGSHWWLGATGAGFLAWALGRKIVDQRLLEHRSAVNTRL